MSTDLLHIGGNPTSTVRRARSISIDEAGMSYLSYISPTDTSPWHTYLTRVDRVLPYLGSLARSAERSSAPSDR